MFIGWVYSHLLASHANLSAWILPSIIQSVSPNTASRNHNCFSMASFFVPVDFSLLVIWLGTWYAFMKSCGFVLFLVLIASMILLVTL